MKGHEFKRWRQSLALSQGEAADALGLKRRVVQYYEKGKRDGDLVKIPRTVRLACYAIATGVMDYHGPEADRRRRKKHAQSDASHPTA
jgi:predicted transcriptional regulator